MFFQGLPVMFNNMQARVLLRAPHGAYLWCPQPAPDGNEEAERRAQFDAATGITGRALRTQEAMSTSVASGHSDYDVAIDGILGVPPDVPSSAELWVSSMGQHERQVLVRCREHMGTRRSACVISMYSATASSYVQARSRRRCK